MKRTSVEVFSDACPRGTIHVLALPLDTDPWQTFLMKLPRCSPAQIGWHAERGLGPVPKRLLKAAHATDVETALEMVRLYSERVWRGSSNSVVEAVKREMQS